MFETINLTKHMASHSELPSDQPLIDFDQLDAASNSDPELMQELINLYFDQAGEIMTGLRDAITASSAPDVNHLAHKLVGASLACGMSAVVVPLRELERQGREGQLSSADTLLIQISGHLELTREKIGSYLRDRQK
jgi:HPt (histidine-containing phosphotransfer) domain-containing protein